MNAARIEGGFVEIDAGTWLTSRGQPAAFFGGVRRRRRMGWCLRDRSRLDLLETSGVAKCSDSSRPFLLHIPCAAPVFTVSGKVLIAPVSARKDARIVKLVPMSAKSAICVTEFVGDWVVMATASRVCRIQVAEGETLSVRPDAAVAWTGAMPTGFCPRLSVWDVFLPRQPRDLLLTFYGPSVVWIEGSRVPAMNLPGRRVYGV